MKRRTRVNFKKDFLFDRTALINFINMSHKEKQMVREWRNDSSIKKWMYSDSVITKKEHASFIKNLNISDKDFYWLVKDKDAGYIGVLYLNKVNLNSKNAYMGIYANPNSRIINKGERLIRILLRLSFKFADLHTLKLEVLEDNAGAIEFYSRAGFRKEGILKEFVFRGGRWKDVIIMGGYK